MGKRKTIIHKLPHDIVVNILSRLPVKSLVRSKCVCKPWRSLISNPRFAKQQLVQSQKKSDVSLQRLLLTTNPLVSIDYEAYNNNGDHDSSKVISELEHPAAAMIKDPVYDVDLVGSCDGLVCLIIDEEEFVLWNPSTRESKTLPQPSSVLDCTFSYGLGCDFAVDDYKLIRVCCPSEKTDVLKGAKHRAGDRQEVLSLKTNIWRGTSNLPTGIELNGNGVFLNGSLHWVASQVSGETKITVIVSFNLTEEKFEKVVAVPDALDESNINFGISRDCLWLFFESNGSLYEGWVMKEFGVKSSWSRLFSFPVDTLPGYKYWQNGLCYTKTGKVLIDHDGWDLLMYDPEEKTTIKFKTPDDSMNYFNTIMYCESLVSPNFDDVTNGENHVQEW